MPLTGRSVERLEDTALLTGSADFADDVGVKKSTTEAAILRSPYAHARLLDIDIRSALQCQGVHTVLVGADVVQHSKPFVVGVKQPMQHWSLAVDKVRYVGEPVAIVIADNRYLAEDALEHIVVAYEPLAAVVDPLAALTDTAPQLHESVGSNKVSQRDFSYGDPDSQFSQAAHIVELSISYPRNACTPIEGFVVIAEYKAAEDSYDVLANFQGPYTLHPVMALALKVPGNRLRLRTPANSGGSFGVKQAIFPYIVAMCLAARKTGRPVKWVEDRLEHLLAATSATNRVTTIAAAVTDTGKVLALRYHQLDDCGAYLRAPEPASLYRMHGNLTGAYDIRHLAVRNCVVLSNKTPSGLNRGFGGPQTYYALERLMQCIAIQLNLDPLQIMQHNLIPAADIPYHCAAGALLDSGDYPAALQQAIQDGRLKELKQRQQQARAEGRYYGIGFAAVVEPSISNMGYITTVMTATERQRAGAKDGAAATATIAVDPLGSVTVNTASIPQGQGHQTVLAQVIADVLGLPLTAIQVNVEHDSQKDAWSIASGNYSSRFAAAVAGTAQLAAQKIRKKVARIASRQLNIPVEQIEFANGLVFAADNPENAVEFRRIAGLAHWSASSLPDDCEPGLRETVFWSPPELLPPDEQDHINSSGSYGFIFDFCAVEIDADTGQLRIDKYVTMHDAGRRLNPALVDGQIRGGFAHALGAALLEEFRYDEDGNFLSGTLADYLIPTACEVPEPLILHMESPSPVTPLGAKGVGEGNCMSTPVCLANAVADALGVNEVTLPLTPGKLLELIHGPEQGFNEL